VQEARPRSHVLIAAAVLALHVVLSWLLLARTRELSIPSGYQSLEIVLIPPQPKKAEPSPSAVQRPRPPSKRQSAPSSSIAPIAPPQSEPNAAPAAPVDWAAELGRAAEEAARAAGRPKPRDFGFPEMDTPTKSAEFGWDYAATHRTQSIPGGGLLVNLNDNCVLVFVPLPFVFCRPGHKPANGELFKGMAPQSLTEQAPPSP
jgi:hypothetical protein